MRLAQRLIPPGILAAIMMLYTSGCGGSQVPNASAPTDPWGVVQVEPGQSIRIGAALSQTDAGMGSDSIEELRGLELAAKAVDNVRGFNVKMVSQDVSCSAGGGESAARGFSSDAGIVAVLGPSCSSACVAAAPIFNQSHMTEISGSCGAQALVNPLEHQEVFLRTVYSDAAEGALAAQYVYNELGKRRIAVLSYGTPETSGYTDSFSAKIEELGGTVLVNSIVTPGDSDYLLAFVQLANMSPDIIYAPLHPGDAVSFTVQRQNTILKDVPLVGNRFYWSNRYLSQVGNAGGNVYATGPSISGITYENLNNAYILEYKTQATGATHAYTYDAAMILLNAIERVAVVGDAGRLYIGRKALHDAVYATSGYDGASGTLTCSALGDCSVVSIAVGQIKNGQWQTVFIP